jgi:hypothetical protein
MTPGTRGLRRVPRVRRRLSRSGRTCCEPRPRTTYACQYGRPRRHDRDPGDAGRRPDRSRASPRTRPGRTGGPGDRHGPRVHGVVAAADGVADRAALQPDGGRRDVRLPRPRAVRRPVHAGRQGDLRPGCRGPLRAPARVRPRRDGGVLHGRLRGAAAGRAARRRRRRGRRERARPLVLPGHRGDAPGALRGRAPRRTAVRQARAEHTDLPGALAGTGTRAARARRRAHLAGPRAGRARGQGHLLPARPRP